MTSYKALKWLNVAEQIAQFSKDPSSKVGCVILDNNGRSISHGYNGFIAGANEAMLSWDRPSKYFHVIHAEMNAILQAKRDLAGCTLICTQAPCLECLKTIYQSRINKIYYGSASIMLRADLIVRQECIKMIESVGALGGWTPVNLITRQTYIKELSHE